MNMTSAQMTTIGIALGICYAVQKFVHNPSVKAAALGVAGVIIAKQIPMVQEAL